MPKNILIIYILINIGIILLATLTEVVAYFLIAILSIIVQCLLYIILRDNQVRAISLPSIQIITSCYLVARYMQLDTLTILTILVFMSIILMHLELQRAFLSLK